MTTRLYASLGKGGTDGETATNVNLAGGGDNPLILGGTTGWVFEEDNVSPDGPVDGLGFTRPATEGTSYLRAEWEASGTWEGIRVWVYIPGAPGAHWNFIRLTGPADTPSLINLFLRTTGRVRLYEGASSISASESGVLVPGWYCFVVQANHGTQQARYRILDTDLEVVHEWTGAVAHSQVVQGARVGEVTTAAHGFSTIDIGSRVAWGSTDTAWIPGDVDPYTEAPDPPPATSAVSHYNTAEGLTINDLAPVGDGIHSEGHRLSARLGTGGSVRVTSSAIHGSRAYRVLAGAGSSAYVQWGLSSRAAAFRVYLDVPATPSHTTQVMILRNSMEEPVGLLALENTSRVLLQCARSGVATSAALGGTITFPAKIRLELFVDTDNDVVKAAWGYEGEGRSGTAEITTRDLESVPVVLAQVGKMHGTQWNADFVLDDLAANVRATDHIGGYAESYTIVTTVAADLPADEPGTPFELEGFGTATWTQVPVPGMPTVPITQDGTKATGVRPYTVDGGELQFDYGGAVQRVGVLYATETLITADGEVPIERELIT